VCRPRSFLPVTLTTNCSLPRQYKCRIDPTMHALYVARVVLGSASGFSYCLHCPSVLPVLCNWLLQNQNYMFLLPTHLILRQTESREEKEGKRWRYSRRYLLAYRSFVFFFLYVHDHLVEALSSPPQPSPLAPTMLP
jgi:hypothetical protein